METFVEKVLSDDSETEFECNGTPSVDSHVTAPLSKIGLKAGMQGLDKAKVNQIIFEATKGSKFHENELRKDEQIKKRITSMIHKLENVTDAQKATSLKVVDSDIELLENTRDLSHVIIHVDMDAFYAAVEMRDNPKLRNVPMAVGSTGMLSTSNYLARRYGVRAAMPGFIGKKLCRELIIVEPNYHKYRQVSLEIQAVLAIYDPHFSSVGLDEAYLDLTAFVRNKLTRNAHLVGEEPTQRHNKDDTVSSGSEEPPQQHKKDDTVSSGSEEPPQQHKKDDTVSFGSEEPPQRHNKDDTVSFGSEELPLRHKKDDTVSSGSEELAQRHKKDDTVSFGSEELTQWTKKDDTVSFESEEPTQWTKKVDAVNFGYDSSVDSILEEYELLQLPWSYWKCAEVVVEEIRHEIFKKTGLTASAGIAPNKMLAKVASDVNKPNGQYLVNPTREGVLKFVQKLPIRKIGGIGKVTERMLNAIGVTTCADLYQKRSILHLLFSPVSIQSFLCICLGIGSAEVYRTFFATSNPEELQRKCHDLCVSLSEDIQKKGVAGRTITLKIKTVDFEVKTRSCTLPRPVSTIDELYTTASELLRLEIQSKSPRPLNLRLMGVRLSSLESSKMGCKQGTLKELFKQHIECGSSVESPKIHHNEQINDECSYTNGDMAICPVCNQSVPAENTSFNQHIDECLNCSIIEEDLSDKSMTTVHQESCSVLSQVSLKKSLDNLQRDERHNSLSKESESTSSSSSNSRKRKAVSVPAMCTTRNKRVTLHSYFTN